MGMILQLDNRKDGAQQTGGEGNCLDKFAAGYRIGRGAEEDFSFAMKNKASCPWGCSKQKKRKRTADHFLSKDSLQEGENKNRGCILGEGYCIINLVESRGWRHSSAGRALASHARGHWFESSRLHHKPLYRAVFLLFFFLIILTNNPFDYKRKIKQLFFLPVS